MADGYTWLNDDAAVAERLVLDVAARLQLSPTQHEEATTNYNSLARTIDEGDHPLSRRVTEIYPSGSFAIGAAILGQVRNDQHDVDVVVEMDLPLGTSPEFVLRNLEAAIKGKPGSRYYDMVVRNSRCVTVRYKDGRTIDLMPAVRNAQMPERVVQIFHFDEETGESYHKEVNPKGFASRFNSTLETSQRFDRAFQTRLVLLEKAETQPLPGHSAIQEKSPRLVALQLVKRMRNVRWRSNDRKGKLRCPPSVVLAALSMTHPMQSDLLIDETILLANTIRAKIIEASNAGRLLEVRNPAWASDVFTDRWPENNSNQLLFASDLESLSGDLRRLKAGVPMAERNAILARQFGESLSERALTYLGEEFAKARAAGRTTADHKGKVSIIPAAAPALVKRSPFGDSEK